MSNQTKLNTASRRPDGLAPGWVTRSASIAALAAALLADPALAGGYAMDHPAAAWPAQVHCEALPGNDRKVCEKRLKGQRKVAKAYHKAERDPGPRTSYKLVKARTKARYKVRKQQCKSLPDKHARKACKDHTKQAYEARKHALGPKPPH